MAAGDLADALFGEVADRGRQAAHGAGELGGLGDDVVGVPAWKRVTETTAESSGSTLRETIGLQRLDQCRADDDRIDGRVRAGGVAAAAGDGDGEFVGRGHDRPGAGGELADGEARHVVHAVDLVDGPAVHQAVLDHRLAAAAAFFGRLEDDDRRAVEIARLGEVAGGAEQHGGVAVMAAGVHLARHGRGVGLAGLLGDAAARPCRRAGR